MCGQWDMMTVSKRRGPFFNRGNMQGCGSLLAPRIQARVHISAERSISSQNCICSKKDMQYDLKCMYICLKIDLHYEAIYQNIN